MDELADPPEPVAVAVAASGAAAVSNRQRYRATGLVELFGQLDAGLARTDDEDAARRQGVGAAVMVRVDLRDPGAEPGGRRDPRHVERARRGHDVPCPDGSPRRFDGEPAILGRVQGDPTDVGIELHRRLDDGGVTGGSTGDLVPGHEPVRFGSVVGVVGQVGQEVRRDELEGIPAVLPAASERSATLQHDVLAPGSTQEPAHKQAAMARPDDDRVDPPRHAATTALLVDLHP
jgi:hypothetical protein